MSSRYFGGILLLNSQKRASAGKYAVIFKQFVTYVIAWNNRAL